MTTGPKPSQFRQEGAYVGQRIMWDGNVWVPSSRDNITATSDPTASDDNTAGYSVGSIWINTSTDTIFINVDASTGSAIWINIGSNSSQMIWDVVTPIDNGDSPYTASINELIQVDGTLGTVTINFPAVSSSNEGRPIGVKMRPISAATPNYNIQCSPNGSDTIEETKAAQLALAGEWSIFVSDGIDNWIMMG